MKGQPKMLVIVFVAFFFFACDKNEEEQSNCYDGQTTISVIKDKVLEVRASNGGFYLVEENTIDSKLIPCNLPQEFQVDRLKVVISGNVKAIPSQANSPCCVDGLEITTIEKENP